MQMELTKLHKKESKKRGIKQNTKKIKQNSTKSNQKGKTTETAKKMKQNNTKTKQKKKASKTAKCRAKMQTKKIIFDFGNPYTAHNSLLSALLYIVESD